MTIHDLTLKIGGRCLIERPQQWHCSSIQGDPVDSLRLRWALMGHCPRFVCLCSPPTAKGAYGLKTQFPQDRQLGVVVDAAAHNPAAGARLGLKQGLLEQVAMQITLAAVYWWGELLNIHAPAAALTVVGSHHQEGEQALPFTGNHGERLPAVHQAWRQTFKLTEPTLEQKRLQLRQQNALIARL